MFHWTVNVLILGCYSEMLLLLQMLGIGYLMSSLKLQKVPRYLSGAFFLLLLLGGGGELLYFILVCNN